MLNHTPILIILIQPVHQGFPTWFNRVPHTCQSCQNWHCGQPHKQVKQIRWATWSKSRGVLLIFWRILTIKLHHIRNNSGLIEPNDRNIVYSGFNISLIEKIYGSIWLRGPHKIASRAACGPRAAGLKALLYTVGKNYRRVCAKCKCSD